MPSATVVDSGLRNAEAAVLTPRTFLRLYRSDLDVFSTSRLTDFQACLFPGYADAEVTGLFTAPNLDPVGRSFAAVFNQEWVRGSGGVPETVFGWLWYYGPDPTGQLIAGRRLSVPKTLASPGDNVILSLLVYLLRG